jgi:hypothetical protein
MDWATLTFGAALTTRFGSVFEVFVVPPRRLGPPGTTTTTSISSQLHLGALGRRPACGIRRALLRLARGAAAPAGV